MRASQHLANTLWGLARLGFVPGPSWGMAFLAATGPQLQAMTAPELVSLAWAVGKLRMAPGPVWAGQLLMVCACVRTAARHATGAPPAARCLHRAAVWF